MWKSDYCCNIIVIIITNIFPLSFTPQQAALQELLTGKLSFSPLARTPN